MPQLSHKEFIKKIAPGAQAAAHKYGVPASVTIAQAILESNWGNSSLADKYYNLFGIKAQNGQHSIDLPTNEVIGGQTIRVHAYFRVYDSWADSIDDHGHFVTGPRYKKQGIGTEKNPHKVCDALQRAGYATDPTYASQLKGLIDSIGLTAYDVH